MNLHDNNDFDPEMMKATEREMLEVRKGLATMVLRDIGLVQFLNYVYSGQEIEHLKEREE